jgi:hypothetical protein
MSDINDQRVFADKLARMIRDNPNFKNQRIVPGSCNTARPTGVPGEPTFAQRLANYLGVPVTGSTDFTYPGRGDFNRIPANGDRGVWKTVYPQPDYKGPRF